MATVTHYFLIQTKEDGTTELLGLFKTLSEAEEVKLDWNKDSNIPLEQMQVIEKTEEINDL